jgi:tripartite-type tricarboxylate transporter receptor subunit TctC
LKSDARDQGLAVLKSLKVLFWILVATASGNAMAQAITFPSSIRVVVPFAVGGGADAFARAVAAQLGKRLGVTVYVENRAGAGSLIGSASVAKSPADGSTLLFSSSSVVTAVATSKKPTFDFENDLVPVAIVCDSPLLVGVSATSAIKTPADLVTIARANPDTVTYGSSGVGGLSHLTGALLEDAAKIHMLHIPYKGSTPALLDVAAGAVDMTFGSYSALAAQLASGRVVAIAVTTLEPSPSFPGLPTMATVVPGYSASVWYGLFAPAKTPPGMVRRLNAEIVEIAKSPELRPLIKSEGASLVSSPPQELSRRMRVEYATWKKLATEKHLVAE